MEFYETVEVIKVLEECEEFGNTNLVLLNGIFGIEEKYGIAEPGGFYVIEEEYAKEILAE